MTPRIYIDAPLQVGSSALLTTEHAHYLKNVLRRSEADAVHLFNGRDGEFEAAIIELTKKGGLVSVKTKIRDKENEPDLALCFAQIKRGAAETIVQKATEIGVAEITPVLTEHSVAPRLNIERLQAIAIEAAEQCARLTVPSIDEPVSLAALLSSWPESRRLMFCDEAGDDENEKWGGRKGRAAPVLETLTADNRNSQSWAILIGPEGGFSAAERTLLKGKDFVTPVTLGPRILRADTAAIAALALWQAALGDWRRC